MKPGMRNLLIALGAVALFAIGFGLTALVVTNADDSEAVDDLERAHGLCAAVGADASGLDVDALYSKSDDERTLSTETSEQLNLETAQVLLSCVVGQIGGPDDLREQIKTEASGSAKFGTYFATWETTDGRFKGSVNID